jgi:hypothetical protein
LLGILIEIGSFSGREQTISLNAEAKFLTHFSVTFDYVVINHQKVEIESESMPVGFC